MDTHALQTIFGLFLTATILIAGAVLPGRIRTPAGRQFSAGLIVSGIATAVWSYAAIYQATASELVMFLWATLLLGFVSLLFFTAAAMSEVGRSAQEMAVFVTIVAAIITSVLGITYPAQPALTAGGLLAFGFHPVLQFLISFLVAATIVPAALTVARRFALPYSGTLFRISLFAVVIASPVLLVSTDRLLWLLVGITLSLAGILLVMTAIGMFDHSLATKHKR